MANHSSKPGEDPEVEKGKGARGRALSAVADTRGLRHRKHLLQDCYLILPKGGLRPGGAPGRVAWSQGTCD